MQKIEIAFEKTEYFDISELHVLQGKLKTLLTEDYQKLKSQIVETKFAFPFNVWRDTDGLNGEPGWIWILGGTQRHRVLTSMREEGFSIPRLPCNVIEANTLKEAKQRVLQDITQYGRVEGQELYEYMETCGIGIDELLKNYRVPDLNMLEFKVEYFDNHEVPPAEEEDGGISGPVESRVKPGDLWILGEHRLLCGDSTSATDTQALFAGEIAELCFTSPPYSDQRDYGGDKNLSVEHLAMFMRAASGMVNYFAVNLGYSRKGGEVFPYWDGYLKEAKDCGLKLLSWNIWDKGYCSSVGYQTAMFGISHEWIFVLGKQPKELNRTLPNKWAGEVTNHTFSRTKEGESKKTADGQVGQFSQLKTIISIPPQTVVDGFDHPARFPVALPRAYIEAMTDSGQIVYEPFAGSGTTLIACQEANRRCLAMELEPKYCDTILSRWESLTGEKAKLQETGSIPA